MDLYYLQLLIGFIGLTALAIPFSSNIKEINYRNIAVGILFQILLAFILIKIPIIVTFFKSLGDGVIALQPVTLPDYILILGLFVAVPLIVIAVFVGMAAFVALKRAKSQQKSEDS